jgi:transmembrane sensor
LKLLGLVAGAAGLTWFGRDYTPLPALMADYRTATGERRWVALNDGSRIQLNSASAFDAVLTQERRLVQLRQGEILVNPVADNRPFWVQTRDGYLRALGTRFLVREETQGTMLAVQQGTVAVFADNHAAGARQVINPGEQVLFDRSGIRSLAANGLDPWAWSEGVISARDMRLDAFLAELGRYRNGLLRCSEAVAGLRVSGTYQLDDTDEVLGLVAHSLNLDVTYRSRYWVTVTARV